MNMTTIKPGFLVALKSSVTGGVSYARVDLEKDSARAKWETTRVIQDPAEHDRAAKVRGKALAEIRMLCATTAFGLLCPEDRESMLNEAVQRARAMVDAHNATATFTRVYIHILKGRIASTDEEAARALTDEVQGILNAMNAGIDKLDAKAIREAADRAKAMGAMLGDAQAKAVSDAIDQARKAARMIVKRVEKEGEKAEIVIKDIQRGAIEKARFAFLDLDTPDVASNAPAMPAANVGRFAAIDTETDVANETCDSASDGNSASEGQ